MTPRDLVATPGRQLALAAVGLALILAVLTSVYFLWLRTPYAVLFTDLRPADAATIVAELDKKKTPYRLAEESRTILVPGKLADTTRLSVMTQELPLKGTVGFELFNKSDMGLTEFAQQINYRRALQGELARTIMALADVETARVHLSLAENSVFREDRRPAKASVTLIPRAGHSFTPRTIRGVQSLVAAAVQDLAVANVVVLDAQGAVITLEGAEPVPVDAAGALEESFARPIRLALARAFPARDLDVAVSAPAGVEQLSDLAGPQAAEADATLVPPPRLYGLLVRVMVQGEVTPEDRARIQQLAIAAGGLDPALGDALTVTALTTAGPAPAGERAVSLAAAATGPPGWVVSIGLAVVLLVLSALAFLLHRRRPLPRPMSEAQRARYAARLSDLLTQEPHRAAP
ncbi:flagellar basal-body MS-ring/collar protein FliF [Caulobacter sp. DWR1-3-2b1]|uniref:flagellar basal-body MS-ring/collar protein FliF n=1 Tax=Caulobacter sp. DWR1-3-2b1 TaxID=2804670 RepID=UPI003CF77BE4